MIIPADNDECQLNKNIIIYKKREDHPQNKSLLSIDDKHPMYDPLLYVLMFPYGDKGWELKCKPGHREYYAYRLMLHSGSTFNIVIEWIAYSSSMLLICTPRLKQHGFGSYEITS